MSIKLLYASRGANFAGTSNTTYWAGFLDNNQSGSPESSKTYTARNGGGTFSNLSIYLSANTLSVTTTYSGRPNSGAGNLSVAISSSSTGLFQDNTNSDTIVTDDTFDIQSTTGVATGSSTIQFLSVVFSPDSNFRVLGDYTTSQLVVANPYQPISGGNRYSTESVSQIKFRTAGNLKKSQFNITSNTSVTAVTAQLRVNSANVNNLITVTALTTGLFEDTTSSDSISVGDLVNWNITGVTVGSVTYTYLNIALEATDVSINQIGSCRGISSSSGATVYSMAVGESAFPNATENFRKVPVDFDWTASKLEVNCDSNATTSASTYDLRVGGVSSSLTVSITAGTTGYFSDLTNTVSGNSGDLINTRIVNGGGGTLTIKHTGMLMSETQSVATGRTSRLSMMGVS